MTCNIHRNLFLYFCLLPTDPQIYITGISISLWKAATSREEYGSIFQRQFRMSCSKVYPVLIPCFSCSFLSSPCWHHQLPPWEKLATVLPPSPSCFISFFPITLLSLLHNLSQGLKTTTYPASHSLCVSSKGCVTSLSLPAFIFFFWPSCCLTSPLLTAICHTQVTPAPPGTLSLSSVGCLLVLPWCSCLWRAFRQDITVTR